MIQREIRGERIDPTVRRGIGIRDMNSIRPMEVKLKKGKMEIQQAERGNQKQMTEKKSDPNISNENAEQCRKHKDGLYKNVLKF